MAGTVLRRDPFATVPACPVCDGPCQEEFPRSPWRFPDRLTRSADTATETPDTDIAVSTMPSRGRRPQTSPQGRMRRPHGDRAVHLEADRAVRPDGDRAA